VADRSIVVNPTLVAFIEEVATSCQIPWQTKLPLYGATDAGAIHVSGKGVPSAVISIPCRYIHSPASLMKLDDFENTCRLLIEVAGRGREALERLYQSRQ
jgi:endoglucanase